MILFDTPRACVGADAFRRYKRTAHLGSTLRGTEGTAELLAFAARIGLKAEWLQASGDAKEHFDLFDGRIGAARALGAIEVTPREFVRQVVTPKREGS